MVRAGLGLRASLIRANALLRLGKGADAAAAFQQLLQGEADKGMRLIEQDGLALALEAQGQIDKAIEVYNAMASEAQQAGNFYADRALFAKARCCRSRARARMPRRSCARFWTRCPRRRCAGTSMTAWPLSATSNERLMSFPRLLAARAGCVLSLLLALCLSGCGSSALHRATEERHEYPAGVVQMLWRTVIHPYLPAMRSPKNAPRALWSIRALSWARARARWQRWIRRMAG
jgi:tetratricopeptide (TPR) repeat protein